MAKRNFKLINPDPSPVDRGLDASRQAKAAQDRVGNSLGTKVAPDKGAARSIPATTPASLDGDTLDNAVDVTGSLWNADARGNLGRSSLDTQPSVKTPLPDPPGAKSMGIDTGNQHEVGDDASKSPFGRS